MIEFFYERERTCWGRRTRHHFKRKVKKIEKLFCGVHLEITKRNCSCVPKTAQEQKKEKKKSEKKATDRKRKANKKKSQKEQYNFWIHKKYLCDKMV